MIEDKSAGDQAREELILAAIKVFADIGVDAVTSRMINREAKHRNNSSIHYHFGGKEGLVVAVNEFIQSHFDAIREPAVSKLEANAADGSLSVRDVMHALVDPYVRIIEDFEWGYSAVRTIARMEFDGKDEILDLLSQSAGQAMKRLARLHRQALPELSPQDFDLRFNHIITSTILGFANYRNLHKSYLGDIPVDNLRELGAFYVKAGEAVLTAPGASWS